MGNHQPSVDISNIRLMDGMSAVTVCSYPSSRRRGKRCASREDRVDRNLCSSPSPPETCHRSYGVAGAADSHSVGPLFSKSIKSNHTLKP